jgi:ATP-dependent Clp protease protease subunit
MMKLHNTTQTYTQPLIALDLPVSLASPQTSPPPIVLPSRETDGDTGARIVRIYDPVGADLSTRVVEELLSLDAHAPGEPIHMFLYSPGGCVVSGLAIIDAIRHIESPVFTYAIGFAASMAAVILACGEKDHRYILPHSRVMIHQASGGAGGTLDNVRATLAFHNELEEESNALLAKATGRSIQEIRDASRVDNWLKATAARDFGLVDHILSHAKPATQTR